MSKIIFKKLKNIINIYFNIKNYLKNNRNYIVNETLTLLQVPLSFEATSSPNLEWDS